MDIVEWVEKTGLKLSEGTKQKLAGREMIADVPHTQEFLGLVAQSKKQVEALAEERKNAAYRGFFTELKNVIAFEEPKTFLRTALAPFSERYKGLNLIEKYAALQGFSSSARIADTEKDAAVIEVFQQAFASAKYPRIKELPKLVICESDQAFAKAFAGGGMNTVFVSSNLIEILQQGQTEKHKPWEKKLEVMLRHELSHVNDLSRHKYAFLEPSHLMGFSRKRAENRADDFGMQDGAASPEMIEAMAQLYCRSKDLMLTMPVLADAVKTEIGEFLPDGVLKRKFIKATTPPTLEEIVNKTVLSDDRTHPSLIGRIGRAMKAETEYKGRN